MLAITASTRSMPLSRSKARRSPVSALTVAISTHFFGHVSIGSWAATISRRLKQPCLKLPLTPMILFFEEFRSGCRRLASREQRRREVLSSQRQGAARTTVDRLNAPLKRVFVRISARKMERDPGARRGSDEKVGVSDVEACVSHARNEAKLPRAGSVATTGQNQSTSRPYSVDDLRVNRIREC